MSTKLTLFTATLVQDSALSVSGLDRTSSVDQPFTIVDGVPTIVGRGLKGAAVAMARRFFDPLPRAVSDEADRRSALRRSAWEFGDATTIGSPSVRAGVGICHKTGARAHGVLYDREVIAAGTKWQLAFRVDWWHVESEDEGREAEGILGYVLAKHWMEGRCWLGGGAARGLGWCHIEDLHAYRLDAATYDVWIESGRVKLPPALKDVPVVEPTRSWSFRTLDVDLSFGEYRPDPSEAAWGLDMLAVGPHDSERAVQPTGDGCWAKPSWATDADTPEDMATDRAILMEGDRPLLPGASVRGPLRHAFSRAEQAVGRNVQDPHLVQGDVGMSDPAGLAFGTVAKSSRILIRDGHAGREWAAAKLHMHAEDEFSAGSYGSAKRDAVRVLQGVFPIRIVIEGPTPDDVEPLVALIDRQVALGTLGHLPVGGHKTRGAGWGRWQPREWRIDDVRKVRAWEPPPVKPTPQQASRRTPDFIAQPPRAEASVRASHGSMDTAVLTLGAAAQAAQSVLGERPLVAWWCDPTIDLTLTEPPATFGRAWPLDEKLAVDEVAFYSERAVWRAARSAGGVSYVLIEEVESHESNARRVDVIHTPARLHGFKRFAAADTGRGNLLLREWRVDQETLGFTIAREDR